MGEAKRRRELGLPPKAKKEKKTSCLLYTSDAADDMQCVDLGGRRIIKKKGGGVETQHSP